ncbi:response regulator [Cohnella sp. WQ 127256]|uniref:response regulator n=1 Tax=Cohnella sp. WQ 127256 TaxID=2938790 RepID=UPI0021173ACC|nr:response regulator [Cohnella sp. WQ 127256]
MYSLLITEDESWTREVLVNADYWRLCGITRIFEADNGEDALHILQTEKVDFLLSDIRMPIMNGLELLAQINETHPSTTKVMLTGYDDFEYIRTAMRLGAHDYMLKPVNDDEMLQLFLKLASQKNEHQAERHRRVMEESKWNQSRHVMREQLLMNWFSGREIDEDFIKKQCKELDIEWKAERYVVFLLEVDQLYILLERFSRRDLELFHYGIHNIVEEYVKETGLQYYLFEIDERIVVWCESMSESSKMEYMLERIRDSVKRFIKVTVSVGVSGKHDSKFEVFQAYTEALNSLKMKMYIGNDRATFFENLTLEDKGKLFNREMQQRVFNCVASGNEGEIVSFLSGLFDEIRRNQLLAGDMDEIMQALVRILWENREHERDAQACISFEECLSKVNAFDTLHEIQEYITARYISVTLEAGKNKKHRKSKLIVDVLHDLDVHYMEEVSLQKLADKFFVNSSYLSRLFKEEVGEIFTKYLMKLRIAKAQHLLKTTHMKVYEVSEAVGYTDVKYFNKIFKDLTGLTPADHRSL